MTYNDTVNWMFDQLPMYQNKGKVAYKVDLSNTLLLAKHLQNPEIRFQSVHVAGTNGKGSTSHMIASILQEAGYKVGLYTSPHLKDYRERIKINGKPISKQFVIDFIKRNKHFFEDNQLSFFEMTVGLAFEYFAKKEIDIAIIEVGLGGRLDSTNIIKPLVSVITNIGKDHTQFLGDTLEKIAFEKGGIIKSNTPVVIGEKQRETTPVFLALANKNNTTLSFAESIETQYKSDLKGSYQNHNMKTAVMAVNQLQKQGFKISNASLSDGLSNVIKNTTLLGRWQVLQDKPKVICDTAHNREGLTYTLQQLEEEVYETLHIVIGVVNDKNLSSIIKLFPKKAKYYFCKANISRALDASVLKDVFNEEGYHGNAYDSVKEAYNKALDTANIKDVIYVGGSTFVVAEII